MCPDDWPELRPIVLSERDWELFVAAVQNPPPPNDELKKLMTEYGPWQDGAKFTVEDKPK